MATTSRLEVVLSRWDGEEIHEPPRNSAFLPVSAAGLPLIAEHPLLRGLGDGFAITRSIRGAAVPVFVLQESGTGNAYLRSGHLSPVP